MAKRRKPSSILLYNLLLHEVSVINKSLPEDRKLSMKERYDLISKKLYPSLKGTPLSRVKKTKLREDIVKKITRIPKKKGCDVLAIPKNVYQDIDYFAIGEFIRDILPKCIWVMVNADGFGQTKIFNTRDYDYYSSGISDITNRINEYVRSLPAKRKLYDQMKYFGDIQVRPKKKNDGDPESYYLEMILEGPDVEHELEKEAVEVPKVKKTKKEKKSSESIKNEILQRVKNMKSEKSRIKTLRRNIEKKIYEHKIFLKKQKTIPDKVREQILKKLFKQEKAKIEKSYKNKTITKEQRNSLIKRITEGFGQNN